jgi:mono/diheme cytochrome c family protein
MSLIIFFLVLPYWVQAQTKLGDLAYLYKMSQSIRGINPTDQDKQELQDAQSQGHTSEFFTAKSKQYLTSANHIIKMSYRLSELFQVQFPIKSPVGYVYKKGDTQPTHESSLDALFSSLAKDDLSWDLLAVGREYTFYPEFDYQASRISDFGFFQNIASLGTNIGIGSLADTTISHETDFKIQNYTFDPKQKQIAGAITTPRFFERYANSQTNHNRRRAAAIYRIFLCDNMSPVVPSSKSNDPEIVKLLYPDHSHLSEGEIASMAGSRESLHGAQASCIGCHQKLDPVGHVFDSSPLTLSKASSRGALVMIRSEAKSQTVVTGFSELGQALIQQPEYERCQVQHFWKWFIGQDIPLDTVREAELVKKFADVQHKTNDFIQYLVLQPEFRYRLQPSAESELASDVRKLFKRCNECHQGNDDYRGPDLAVWPLRSSNSLKTPQQWLDLISAKINLPGHGTGAKMPPPEAQWTLTEDDFTNIQKWISLGAPDEFGKVQVSP